MHDVIPAKAGIHKVYGGYVYSAFHNILAITAALLDFYLLV